MLSVINPLIAAALFALAGLDLVFAVDLVTFVIAFIALAGFIRVPVTRTSREEGTAGLPRKTANTYNLLIFG